MVSLLVMVMFVFYIPRGYRWSSRIEGIVSYVHVCLFRLVLIVLLLPKGQQILAHAGALLYRFFLGANIIWPSAIASLIGYRAVRIGLLSTNLASPNVGRVGTLPIGKSHRTDEWIIAWYMS